MQIAAFAVGCLAAVLALMSLAWQVYSWRTERRFSVTMTIRDEKAGFGTNRYSIRTVATNEGGTTEWVEQVSLHATYDRELNRSLIHYSPELVRSPSMDRELRPRNRFESEFNLLSAQIGGGGIPISVVAVASFASGREVRSEPLTPSPSYAEAAREPNPVADVNAVMAQLPEGWNDDYFPSGPFGLCPDCKTEIPVDARVCRFCGFRIESAPDGPGQEEK
jgi:hypothetical protein